MGLLLIVFGWTRRGCELEKLPRGHDSPVVGSQKPTILDVV